MCNLDLPDGYKVGCLKYYIETPHTYRDGDVVILSYKNGVLSDDAETLMMLDSYRVELPDYLDKLEPLLKSNGVKYEDGVLYIMCSEEELKEKVDVLARVCVKVVDLCLEWEYGEDKSLF